MVSLYSTVNKLEIMNLMPTLLEFDFTKGVTAQSQSFLLTVDVFAYYRCVLLAADVFCSLQMCFASCRCVLLAADVFC